MPASGLEEKFIKDANRFLVFAKSRSRSLTHREMLELTFGEYPLKGLDIRALDPFFNTTVRLGTSMDDERINKFARKLVKDEVNAFWTTNVEMLCQNTIAHPILSLAVMGWCYVRGRRGSLRYWHKNRPKLGYVWKGQTDQIFRHIALEGAPAFNLLVHAHEHQHTLQHAQGAWVELKLLRINRRDSLFGIIFNGLPSTKQKEGEKIDVRRKAYATSSSEMLSDLRVILTLYYRKHGTVPVTENEFWVMINEADIPLPTDKAPLVNNVFKSDSEIGSVLSVYKKIRGGFLYTQNEVEEYRDSMIEIYGLLLETLGDSQGSKRFNGVYNECLSHKLMLAINSSTEANLGSNMAPILAMMDRADVAANCQSIVNALEVDGENTSPAAKVNLLEAISIMRLEWRARMTASADAPHITVCPGG